MDNHRNQQSCQQDASALASGTSHSCGQLPKSLDASTI
jgi:hypothetical protein